MQKSRGNFISETKLETVQESEVSSNVVHLRLSFSITGPIRRAFNQPTWEKAYNRHDNSFRLEIHIVIKINNQTLLTKKYVRKAVLFWTRNPKIPFRIWIFIVQEDVPLYPLSVEEALSLLFDINKIIEVSRDRIRSSNGEIHAHIRVSWGRHDFTEPVELSAKTNSTRLD
ncbi:MAG TPA: hypothetical protein VE130_11170 [Nitrososphaeraceae archaeon]|nr:hypothetical protein [Nitrososphaeraceae archaeon]